MAKFHFHIMRIVQEAEVDIEAKSLAAAQKKLEKHTPDFHEASVDLLMHFDGDHEPGVFMFRDIAKPSSDPASSKKSETIH